MKRYHINFFLAGMAFLLAVLLPPLHVQAATPLSADVCVYGATPAGIMAAYTARKKGKSVILIEPGKRIGGMTAGGLGWTDIGDRESDASIIKGYALEFYQRIGAYYEEAGAKYTFEPKVALATFKSFLSEVGLTDDVILYQRRIVSAQKSGNTIQSIVLEDAANPIESTRQTVLAKVFLDCSYEGDLMARAGVSYTVGREANAQYGETGNGVQLLTKHQFPDGVDPYVVKGDPTSGLLWGILPDAVGNDGDADNHVQSYNFRITLTNDAANRISIASCPPDNYDPSRYELLIRMKEVSPWKDYKDCLKWDWMPNHKCDMNNQGGFSTDMIGASWNYPEATYQEREAIFKQHLDYTQGLLYFLWTDSRIPEKVRTELAKWGYPRDEYAESNHFTPQLYIREARRMIGRLVMTQKYCEGKEAVDDPIAWAAYTMDSHNCGRYVVNGMVKNEGDVQVHISAPYSISYRAITPVESEARNLLVPVCLSASHIAFGSIRMEPVYMVLGETSALAACQAIDEHDGCVQAVETPRVIDELQKGIATAVSSPAVGSSSSVVGRYNLLGQYVSSSTIGLQIVHYADGSSKKTLMR
jgi:hypothetical protein